MIILYCIFLFKTNIRNVPQVSKSSYDGVTDIPVYSKNGSDSNLLEVPSISNWASSSVQFSSVAQSCPTLCNPVNCNTPGPLVHHQLPEFTQTHVHQVGDAIQPSHPLSSPSPPASNPSRHQGLFQ